MPMATVLHDAIPGILDTCHQLCIRCQGWEVEMMDGGNYS